MKHREPSAKSVWQKHSIDWYVRKRVFDGCRFCAWLTLGLLFPKDSDDSGYISAENLREFLGDDLPQDEIDEIIKEADITKDNKISYSEFLALWEDKNEEKRDDMVADLRAHHASLSSSSNDSSYFVSDHYLSSSHHKDDLRADNESDHRTLARANYIEGKQFSERRVKSMKKVDVEEAKKVLFADNMGALGIKPPNPNALAANPVGFAVGTTA